MISAKTLVGRAQATRAFQATAVFLLLGLALAYGFQGVRSAFRLYPSVFGYMVHDSASTPPWVAANVLFEQGINPYSDAGVAATQTVFFGRPLTPADRGTVNDEQRFSYPLYTVLLYLPLIGLDFSIALVALWALMAAGFAVTTWLWLRLEDFPKGSFARLLALTLLAAIPEVYYALQSRQLTIAVLALVLSAVYLAKVARPGADAAAGFVLWWATIKPQSSVLVIGYIVLVYYLAQRGLSRSVWFLAGLVGTGLVSMAWTLRLMPGWIGDFLATLASYRQYAGGTGAEGLFGPGVTAWGASVVFALPAVYIVAVMLRRGDWARGHQLAIGYLLALSVFLFPSHQYNLVFLIPLLISVTRFAWEEREREPGWVTLIVALLLVLAVACMSSMWLQIAQEGLAETLARVAGALRALARFPILGSVPALMAAGALVFWRMARQSAQDETQPASSMGVLERA